MRLLRRKNRRKAFWYQVPFILAIFGGFMLFSPGKTTTVSVSSFADYNAPGIAHVGHTVGRHLLATSNASLTECEEEALEKAKRENKTQEGFDFPDDPFTDDQKWHGAIIVHIIVILYMFLGLAIICDEYFESSLERICEVLHLKDDVAGATFMAAGGSAPELFTSIMGVFVAKNDIGIGTIVGSAVFNVLFVIALCSFFAPNLPLTYWPLVRDSTFYCFGIVVLVACILDQKVHLYEAIVLFCCYLLYVTLMVFNEQLNKLVDRQLGKGLPKARWRVWIQKFTDHKIFEVFIYLCICGNIIIVIIGTDAHVSLLVANYVFSAIFVIEMLIKWIGFSLVGYWRDPFNAFDGVLVFLIFVELALSGSSYAGSIRALRLFRFFRALRGLRVIRLLRMLRVEKEHKSTQTDSSDYESLTKVVSEGSMPQKSYSTKSGGLVRRMTVKSYTSAEDLHGKHKGKEPKKSPSSTAKVSPSSSLEAEAEAVLAGTDDAADTTTTPLMADAGTGKDEEGGGEDIEEGKMSPSSDAVKGEADNGDDDGDDEDSDDDDDDPWCPWPPPGDGCTKPSDIFSRIVWFIGMPLSLAFFVTVPDCRFKWFKHLWAIEFINCILWIAALSYVMVWMATILGDMLGIPDPVMGLTLLAAGTSIPDALSSIAVARRGHGDMAVSSSIGSNVFDILVGLPVPWMFYTSIADPLGYVPVYSDGLTIMIITLFVMVALTITVIVLSGWKLSRRLAYSMLILYVLFVTQSLLLEYNVIFPDPCS